MADRSALPIVVSFYTEEPYYTAAASVLAEDCARVGLDCDLVARRKSAADTWVTMCRSKVPFYLEMLEKHRRPILWLDVDSRIGRVPEVLRHASCDIAGFLRGFKYLRDFDPVASPRFFAPFALFFNATERARRFLETMVELERDHAGAATDDFFLHEAWRVHREQLTVLILPPEMVGERWPLSGLQTFCVGRSGNVSKYRREVDQHDSELFSADRRHALLRHEAGRLIREGRLEDAVTLLELALEVRWDEAVDAQLSRLRRRSRPN